MKTLFAGNLPFNTTEQELNDLFSQYGTVENVQIVTARDTGLPRGFAFITVEDESAAAMIEALNGSMYAGRRMKVDETREDQVAPAKHDDADNGGDGEDRRSFRPRRSFRRDGENEDRGSFRRRPRGDRDDFRPRRSFRDRDGEGGGFRRREDRDGDFRPRRSFRRDGEEGGFKREDRGEFRPRRSFRDREDGGFKREDRGEFRPRRSFRDREDGGFKREDRGEFRPRRSFRRDGEEGGNFRARRPFRRESSDFQE